MKQREHRNSHRYRSLYGDCLHSWRPLAKDIKLRQKSALANCYAKVVGATSSEDFTSCRFISPEISADKLLKWVFYLLLLLAIDMLVLISPDPSSYSANLARCQSELVFDRAVLIELFAVGVLYQASSTRYVAAAFEQ